MTKIVISEDSWHLRFVRWSRRDAKYKYIREYTPRDLCSYVWGGLLPAFLWLLLGGLMYAAAAVTAVLTVGAVVVLTFFVASEAPDVLVALGVVLILTGSCGVYRSLTRKSTGDTPAFAMMAEAIRSFKRYCPMIEVRPSKHNTNEEEW